MVDNTGSTLRRRRLARILGQLREQAGMTAEEAATELKKTGGRWSKSKISRIEDRRYAAPSPRDVRDMLDLYGVTDQRRYDALVKLAAEAGQRGWWIAYDDVFQGAHIAFEAEANTIDDFEPLFVPGLLQTEAYARIVTQAALVTEPERSADEIDRRVEARLKRQELLSRQHPPQLWAILDEAALGRPVGGTAIMREQIDHLVTVGERPNITLQIVRAATGAHPGMGGPFVILSFSDPDDAPVVFLESATDGLYLEKVDEIRRYTLRFDHLRAIALGPDESVRYMINMKDRLE